MSEIDLIPADYRQHLQLRWMTRVYIVFFSIMVICVVAGKIWTGRFITAQRDRIKKLSVNENLILRQGKQFEDLKAKEYYLKTRLEALDTLRGGPTADQMLMAVSSAINSSTWITHWKFVRSGEVQKEKSQYRKTGYFIVVPKDKNVIKPWREQPHMEIEGETLNHSSFAEFIRKLLEQPIIDGVHELKTWTRTVKSGPIIGYRLAVTLGSAGDRQ